MYNFDAKYATNELIEWIKNYFIDNGPDCKAVIGISGGKDSSIVAALCVKALGPENVVAVKMPQNEQRDIATANDIIKLLNIPDANIYEVNIGSTCEVLYEAMPDSISDQSKVQSNLPARVRMATLYAIAAGVHGRVANTSNYSEIYIGYSTKFGDNVGDFAPLAEYTVTEVKAIGKELGLPDWVTEKVPEDGLSGMYDEVNIGFTYYALDNYLRKNEPLPFDVLKKVKEMHNTSRHKRCTRIPTASYYNRKEVQNGWF